jgi:phosphate ABC transporter permease subunit PstA/phosphate ABC transporter phosphate-binding protein
MSTPTRTPAETGTSGTAAAAAAAEPGTAVPDAAPRTVLPQRTPVPPGGSESRRRPGAVRAGDRYAVLGAHAAALALTALLFGFLLPLNGLLGFVVTDWLLFLALYGLLVAQDENGLAVRDRLAAAVIMSISSLVLMALVCTIVYTGYKGYSALLHANFFTQDMSSASSLTPLSQGGVLHAIVGTLEQITISLAITIPLGVSCAVFLNEVPGGFARFVRTIVEAMTALPSIVAGLFIYAAFVLVLGLQRGGLAAGCALSVMMLPIIIRASDVVLRLVPSSLKEASYALGSGKLRTIWQVVLPTARSGLATAVILGAARGIGETSPVLLTAGYNKAFNLDPRSGPMTSLPLLVFTLVRLPSQWQIARGFGAAVVLLVLVLALFTVARILGGRAPGELTKRQQRRRVAASVQLAARYHRTRPTSPSPERKDTKVRRSAAALLRRGTATVTATTVLGLAVLFGSAPKAAADSYAAISGAGSTWSSNAMDAWTSDVQKNGMKVNFDATGSSDGRAKYKNNAVDFAVSEIPYGLTDGGAYDAPPPTGTYAYMPIVAGGTSFMYNLKINGHKVTDLRLDGALVAQIFTGAITRWNDPAIKLANPSLALPDEKIVPVVRSDGSGTTAQLTTYFSQRQAQYWDPYCKKAGRTQNPCGVTSFYPTVNGAGFISLSGSQGVSGFVAQDNNEGSITYVEYSYALITGFPVANLKNASGAYVQPTAGNVAVALTKAQIDPVTLTQQLNGVYDSTSPTAYPLSSYSYMIVPQGTMSTLAPGSHFTAAKGKTLSAFDYFFLCTGQAQAPDLGYSPLPPNLVLAGLKVVSRIPGSIHTAVSADGCAAATAPTRTTTSTTGGGTGTPGTTPTGATTPNGATAAPSQAGDPGLGGGSAATGGDGTQVNADPVAIAATSGSGLQHSLMIVAALLLGSVVVLPPIVARRTSRRKENR